MSVDHVSGVAAPKVDPVFLHMRAGMTVIVDKGLSLIHISEPTRL